MLFFWKCLSAQRLERLLNSCSCATSLQFLETRHNLTSYSKAFDWAEGGQVILLTCTVVNEKPAWLPGPLLIIHLLSLMCSHNMIFKARLAYRATGRSRSERQQVRGITKDDDCRRWRFMPNEAHKISVFTNKWVIRIFLSYYIIYICSQFWNVFLFKTAFISRLITDFFIPSGNI